MLNIVINPEKLEKLLVAHWAEFMNVRSLMEGAAKIIAASENTGIRKVQKLTVSRFELADNGFILWLECKINEENFTVELLLELTGSTQYRACLKN